MLQEQKAILQGQVHPVHPGRIERRLCVFVIHQFAGSNKPSSTWTWLPLRNILVAYLITNDHEVERHAHCDIEGESDTQGHGNIETRVGIRGCIPHGGRNSDIRSAGG